MNELAKKRMEKKGDCKEWTPLDCLENLVHEIKTGQIDPEMLSIHWMNKEVDGMQSFDYDMANMNHKDHLVLCDLIKRAVLREWTGF